MMKKLFLVLCLIFSLGTPAFAEYTAIPENLSTQYKKEMEQIINSEYPHIIKDIDKIVSEAKSLHDKIMHNGFDLEDYLKLALIPETCIPSADLDLYAKLLKVTNEKYLGIKYKPIGTDSANPLDDILFRYFKDNGINRTKLTKIILYEKKQIKVVEGYIKQVEKLRPVNS